MHELQPTSIEDAIQQGHENDPLWFRTILAVGASILLLSVFAMVIVALFVASHQDVTSEELKAQQEWNRQAVDPGVKPDQSVQRQQWETVAERQLSEYHWQNETHNVARIPIERAIKILAQKNLQIDFPDPKPTAQQNGQSGGKP